MSEVLGNKNKSADAAIAIGLFEARREGGKVPPPKKPATRKTDH